MKQYRNSIRSKQLIRTAMIELLAEKDLSKITVVDIVKRADLSRNTFYAHYQDVFAVIEELENDFLSEMNLYLDEAIKNREFSEPLSLLQKFQKFVENSIETNRLLLANQNAAAFCEKIKRIFITRVMENLPTTEVKNTEGFLIFLECLAGGFISLYQKSIKKESTLKLDDITSEIDQIYTWGLKKYL
jgi:AcrR family transcriptional regulator